jgi:PAS domain S-box-containing protein
MQIPAIPENELQRLRALQDRALLDTPPEERFDRLTRLAQQMFGCRTALVSLVDAERQWFKSRQGMDACETRRDISFCGHAILGAEIFEIADARLDPCFADNPLVTGPPHIRFYAGAPLTTADGYRIGTLCIIDDKPRRLTDGQRRALRDLADCVEVEINQIDVKQQQQALEQAQQINKIIARAQSLFIRETERRIAFDGLLTDILALTGSEYGFIAEVLRTPAGDPYLKSYAITNIAWNDATRAFYEAHAATGMEFFNLKTLFGAALTSGEPVIANDPYHDPRRGGLPEGHPPLNAFLGIPILHGGELAAMLGIANRPGGYAQDLVDFLQPLLVTTGQLVEAARIQKQHRESQVELARLSRVASETTNGVLITDAEGRVEWINDGFTRITGYTLDEMRGRRPGELLQGAATDPAAVARMHDALVRHEPFEVDVVNYTKAGQAYWIRISCNPLRDASGALQGFMAIQSDITREKNDAERIRASERRLAAVIEGTRIGTWEWNVQTGETVFNARWAEIVGYTLAELAPISIQTWIQLAHPDDLQLSNASLQRHFAGAEDYYDVQCRMRHKQGQWVWVHDRGRVVSWTEEGKPLLMSGTHADITAQKLAEAELNRTANLLGNVLAAATEVSIIATDPDGLITTFNRGAERMLGYPAEALIGKHTPALFHASAEMAARGQELSVEFGRPIENFRVFVEKPERDGAETREWTYVHQDGHHIPVSLVVTTMRDEAGKIVGYLGIAQDITERKQAERALNQFKSTLDRTLDCVFMFDAETLEFFYFNEGALQQVGYSREELLRMHPYDIKPEYTPGQFREMIAPMLAGQQVTQTFETVHRHKLGRDIPVEIFLQYFNRPDERPHFVAIVRDISERKRIDRMKNEFVSTVSHELRTPLTSISGALGLIAGGALEEMPEKARQMIAVAHRNSQRLSFLINDLLDMEKLVAGKMQFDLQAQPLLPLIEHSIEANRAYGAERRVGISLVHAIADAEVRVDSQRLMQVLANLLSNAIKYSPEDGMVEITMDRREQAVRVTVTDRGPGIPAAFRERMFQKFSQADASDTRQRGGTGLGLAISRELVQRMGGSIGFESEEGRGASFFFELPSC